MIFLVVSTSQGGISLSWMVQEEIKKMALAGFQGTVGGVGRGLSRGKGALIDILVVNSPSMPVGGNI
jgi:hypothetical protein